jgi:4-diphosphocytidyl-2-C-methyl-D-erythritol kinase
MTGSAGPGEGPGGPVTRLETTSGPVTRLVARAKLTLTLRVTGLRADGYHLLDSEMVTLDLADTLELSGGDGLELHGEAAAGLATGDDNLVERALRAIGSRAHVRLDKRIPPGAGLGGGSADAAAILRWAGVTDLGLAARLGADVPFCLVGGRARVRGVGEIVEPLPFDAVSGDAYTLLVPPLHVSTPAVYRAWDQLGGPTGDNGNDLEPAALQVEPGLVEWRDRLADATGCRPRLAGSGGTWFVPGEFPGDGRRVVRVAR